MYSILLLVTEQGRGGILGIQDISPTTEGFLLDPFGGHIWSHRRLLEKSLCARGNNNIGGIWSFMRIPLL